jgi:DNA-binding transcriptional regulator GbsR (MarR family)
MTKEEWRDKLVEEIGVHFEGQYNLPPLAARIFAILVLTEKEGLTFEDCLEKRNASKSSISTALNLLLNLEMIEYYTVSGDRRRYFNIKNSFFLTKLEQELKKITQASSNIKKMMEYNQKFNSEKAKMHEPKRKIYMDYLEKSEKTLIRAIEDLKALES